VSRALHCSGSGPRGCRGHRPSGRTC
jgi:hypothetical protein